MHAIRASLLAVKSTPNTRAEPKSVSADCLFNTFIMGIAEDVDFFSEDKERNAASIAEYELKLPDIKMEEARVSAPTLTTEGPPDEGAFCAPS